jgi:Zn-dependent M16 (insulinase) family peptidase
VSAPHPAFECLRTVHIPSLNIDMSEYRHKKTGASHFHLAADNPENVFLLLCVLCLWILQVWRIF